MHLEKKSLARKSKEMEEVSGIEPNRAELFIASRTKSDGSLMCNEARIPVVNAVGGNTKFNTNLHQSSSVSSDQVRYAYFSFKNWCYGDILYSV
ncbi:unnamed protein product [Arabidopsis lyrata]|nr:unnamed protein product [Arabidopsis lyrata]